ncbi:MAG: glycoside hydrolase family 3 N-terminal domain-containing protein [Pseudoxanthomonas sp.]
MKSRSHRSLSCIGLVAALGFAPPFLLAAGNKPAAETAIHPSLWPEVAPSMPADAVLEKRIQDLMGQLSVEEKVGQVVQGDIASITPDDVRMYRLGSIFAGGNSDPGGKYNATPAQWLALADAFYEASMDTRDGGHAIPVIFGIDAVHGQSNIVGATVFPHNIGLGATRNPELMRRIGEVTAAETRITGMEWAFAPTVAVPQDDRWGRSYEGFSESPEIVASFAGPIVEGLQGKVGSPQFLDQSHVIVSVKHFLGDGGTTGGKDQGDTQVSEAVLRDLHGAGYPPAIAAGAQSVMASYNSFNGTKMHGNKSLLTDVLKGRMHFDGFVVGDWNGHGQVPGCTNENCAQAFLAGVDVLMTPDSWKGHYNSLLASVKSGEVPMARLDDAVSRVLRVKFRLGMFEADKPSERALGGKFDQLASPAHRAVARQAVRESLVLLKNNHQTLPLNPRQRLLIAGDGADNLSKQTGGWTLNWQGNGTVRADYPNADSIWDGLRAQVEAAGGVAEMSVDGRYKQKPDAAIVVFGEDSYAEFQGDLPNLLYRPGDDTDLELMKRLKAEGIPIVAVFLSGRPLWVNREINAADAFVAAWLPGSEGAGIADVLLQTPDGKIGHDFKGKLSFSWSKDALQVANNAGQAGYSPQFPLGYGLTYTDAKDLKALPEASGVSQVQSVPGVYFARGKPAPGLSLYLQHSTQGHQTKASTLPASLPDGSLTATAIDHKAQEDSVRLTWSGKSSARALLLSDKPIDVARETNGDVMLMLALRPDAPAKGDVTLGVDCSQGCAAKQKLNEGLSALKIGEWTTIGVPLKCLQKAGADMTRLDRLLILETDGAWQLSISRVSLGTGNQAQHVIGCAQN